MDGKRKKERTLTRRTIKKGLKKQNGKSKTYNKKCAKTQRKSKNSVKIEKEQFVKELYQKNEAQGD